MAQLLPVHPVVRYSANKDKGIRLSPDYLWALKQMSINLHNEMLNNNLLNKVKQLNQVENQEMMTEDEEKKPFERLLVKSIKSPNSGNAPGYCHGDFRVMSITDMTQKFRDTTSRMTSVDREPRFRCNQCGEFKRVADSRGSRGKRICKCCIDKNKAEDGV